MAQTSKPDLRFLIDVSRSDSFLKVTARIVYIGTEEHNAGRVLNPLGDSYRSDWEDTVADLVVDAQADAQAGDGDVRWYGYHARYSSPFSVSLRRAEAMVKTLRKVEKHLAAQETKFGWVQDYYTFLARVADCLGIKHFGWVTERGSFMSESTYRWTDINSLRFHVEGEAKKLVGA